MIIYKAVNKTNGKIYIGLTTSTLSKRISQHEYDSTRYDSYFMRAIRKYGVDGFEWEAIDSTATNQSELGDLEKRYIAEYGTFDNRDIGYNSTSGGDGVYELTKEERAARSERVKGEKNPMYGVPSPNTGKKFSQEHKDKIRKALTGQKRPTTTGALNPSAHAVVELFSGKVFGTIKEAAEYYNISRPTVSNSNKYKRITTFGYAFSKDIATDLEKQLDEYRQPK